MGRERDAAKQRRALIKPYRVTDGRRFRLSHVDPGDTGTLEWRARTPRARISPRTSSGSPSSRRCSTPRIAGRC